MYQDYKTEFRYFDFDIPQLPDGFKDDSWHNNVCPSFIRILDDQIVTLWVDFADPERREIRGSQFFLTIEPNNDYFNEVTHVFETDSWDEMMSKINELFKNQTINKSDQFDYNKYYPNENQFKTEDILRIKNQFFEDGINTKEDLIEFAKRCWTECAIYMEVNHG